MMYFLSFKIGRCWRARNARTVKEWNPIRALQHPLCQERRDRAYKIVKLRPEAGHRALYAVISEYSPPIYGGFRAGSHLSSARPH